MSIRLVLVGSPGPQNLAVTDIRPVGGIVSTSQPTRVAVRVGNYTGTDIRNVSVSLRLESHDASPVGAAPADDRAEAGATGAAATSATATNAATSERFSVAPVDEGLIDIIPAGQSRTIDLTVRLRRPGQHAITASLATDRLPRDDTRTVIVRAVDRVRVLLVDGQRGVAPRDDETFFLRNALAPVSPLDAASHFVDLTVVDAASLAQADLASFDVIVLANVSTPDEAIARSLRRVVEGGAALMIFTGDQVVPEAYAATLGGEVGLLPAVIREAVGTRRPAGDLATASRHLSDRQPDHPLTQVWKSSGVMRPSSANFFTYHPLDPQPASDSRRGAGSPPRVALTWADGSPAAVEHTVGLGGVVLFGFGADADGHDLPARPGLYLPLIYQALGHLTRLPQSATNVITAQTASVSVAPELAGAVAQVAFPTHPDSSTPPTTAQQPAVEPGPDRQPSGAQAALAPADGASPRARPARTRPIPIVSSPGGAVAQFDAGDVAGIVRVTAGDDTTLVSVMPPPVESDVTAATPDELAALSAQLPVVDLRDSPAGLAGLLETQRLGSELTSWVIGMALMLVIAEMLVSYRFSQPR